jgi:sugar (pentulose or hexulose) kinase
VRPLAEPESAALGAALQAGWAVRRAAGENVLLDDLARGFLASAEPPVQPDPRAHATLVPLAARFRELVAQSFG